MKKSKKLVGVIVNEPSAQICGQYDVLAEMYDYEFIILFRLDYTYNPAWQKKYPSKLKYDILPKAKSKLIPIKYSRYFNADIKPVLDKYDFDALILHGMYDSTAVLQAQKWCRRKNRPYFFRSDGNRIEELSLPWWKQFIHKVLIGKRIEDSAGFLTIGENNAGYYSLFGGRADKYFLAPWEVDYHAIDEYYDQAIGKRAELRRKFGLEDNTFGVCCVSRLVMRKGYATLISAVADIISQGVDAKLFLAGSGADEGRIKDVLKNCQIDAYMPGNLDRKEVVELMVACDVFVLVSTDEPWGLVVNEAALCGLPVIASNCVGAAKDLVKEDSNGWIIPRNDAKALSEKLKILSENPQLQQEFSAASREIMLKWRTDFAAIKGYKAALDSVFSQESQG